ncbi:MAG: histidine kinase [Planctomycetaceae bacterium]|nr:histidine kinase [Planctomycetaceae bacterium]
MSAFRLIALFAAAFPMIASTTAAELRLSGRHPFVAADRPEYFQVTFDDSQWQQVEVPASWDSLGLPDSVTRGWYRIHFNWAQENRPAAPLAVLLGSVSDADEVWLNGRLIGKTGTIGEHYETTGRMVRLYDIPDGVLRKTDNLLAIRIQRVYYAGGLLRSQHLAPMIDSRQALRLRVMRAERHATLAETVVFTIWIFAILLGMLLFRTSVLRPAFSTLAVLMAGYVVSYCFELPFCVTAVWHTPWLETCHNLALAAVPFLFVRLAHQMFDLPAGRWSRPLTVTASIGIALAALLPAAQRVTMLTLCLAATVLVGGVLTSVCVRAIRRRRLGAKTFSASLACLFLPTVTYSIPGTLLLLENIPLDVYAAALFAVGCFAVLMSRYQQLHRQMAATSQALLAAEQQERSRISRDLHDGIGQSLAALRIGLQLEHGRLAADDSEAIAAGSANDNGLPRLIQDTESVSAELRRVVMALEPAAVEGQSLAAALRQHAQSIQQRTGLQFNLQLDDTAAPSRFVKEQLYRIFQELIQNTLKHSEAETATALLEARENDIRLRYTDQMTVNPEALSTAPVQTPDGQSNNRGTVRSASDLRTISDRVRMINGHVRLLPQLESGFAVEIEAPDGRDRESAGRDGTAMAHDS